MASCRLYTGVTGLVGQYLLASALRFREPVAVLVRDRRGLSGVDRIEQILASWEERWQRRLPRPVVLEGDIRRPGCGLSPEAADWFRQNIDSVVHSAANLRFQATAAGEPMESNVVGTRHLLELCGDSRVREFHHISSAYSCGRQQWTAPVKEELHPEIGPFGNIYEESKCIAEHLVVRAPGDFSRTIYRPSVIIGDSQTGYTPSFSTVYTPIRLVWLMQNSAPTTHISADDLQTSLGLKGDERRNLVPIDWVAQCIDGILRTPRLHGSIYNLTNPRHTMDRDVIRAMTEAMARVYFVDPAAAVPAKPVKNGAAVVEVKPVDFSLHMAEYESYFTTDPVFDSSRAIATGVCPPCPEIDPEMLVRAFAFAIRAKFTTISPPADAIAREPRRLINSVQKSEMRQTAPGLRLMLTGKGGGCWDIVRGPQGLTCQLANFAIDELPQLYGSAQVFLQWLEGQVALEALQHSGGLVLAGPNFDCETTRNLLLDLRTELQALRQAPVQSEAKKQALPAKSSAKSSPESSRKFAQKQGANHGE